MKITVRKGTDVGNVVERFLKKVVYEKIKGENLDKLADEVSDVLILNIKSKLYENKSIATYTLYNSIRKEKVDNGYYVVYVDAPYAHIVEHGLGDRGDKTYPNNPRKANVYRIQQWIEAKGGLTPQEAKPLAFAIAKTMEREGIYAHPFVEPAIVKTKLDVEIDKKRFAKIVLEGK